MKSKDEEIYENIQWELRKKKLRNERNMPKNGNIVGEPWWIQFG